MLCWDITHLDLFPDGLWNPQIYYPPRSQRTLALIWPAASDLSHSVPDSAHSTSWGQLIRCGLVEIKVLILIHEARMPPGGFIEVKAIQQAGIVGVVLTSLYKAFNLGPMSFGGQACILVEPVCRGLHAPKWRLSQVAVKSPVLTCAWIGDQRRDESSINQRFHPLLLLSSPLPKIYGIELCKPGRDGERLRWGECGFWELSNRGVLMEGWTCERVPVFINVLSVRGSNGSEECVRFVLSSSTALWKPVCSS